VGAISSQRHKNDPGPQLRNSKVAGIHELPTRLVAEFLQLARNVPAVIFKNCVENAAHILYHNCPGANLIHKADHGWKEVSLVFGAELSSSNGKGRTWQPARDDVHPGESCPIKLVEVAFDDGPSRAIQPQRSTCMLINLHQSRVINARLLESKSLPARPSA
jgi:hypothetical protein